jgi:hypothetical protein
VYIVDIERFFSIIIFPVSGKKYFDQSQVPGNRLGLAGWLKGWPAMRPHQRKIKP